MKAGTVLFKIDPAPYQAALSKAQGVLAQEEAQSVEVCAQIVPDSSAL